MASYKRFGSSIVAVVVAFATTAVIACNIPVFRYALERWQPDRLQVLIFHAGPINERQTANIDHLHSLSSDHGGKANVDISLVDIESTRDPELAELWTGISDRIPSEHHSESLPYVIVRGKHQRGAFDCWTGPLSRVKDAGLTESPVRTQLAKRLLSGDSIVWLVVLSKEEKENKIIRERLKEKSRELTKSIELPEGIGLPGSELFSEVPLLLRFSVIEIARDNKEEQFLLSLFRGFQPDAYQQDDPLVVPVFGRGRALEVIPGRLVTENLVEDLTLFLCAACSCQVKQQNPGFDLLLSVDWERELFDEDGERPTQSTGQGQQRKTPVLLTIPPGDG